ncbi:MAG: flagellar basal body L-ring protein FlgH [Burkholderiales bacterium]|nr:flagellar basal body L-ring protein FlgH [Burkholderiales bacterium]MDE2452486.1 flagellar basal body L-ring protein FlgH [Burkholderiales bacterium]
MRPFVLLPLAAVLLALSLGGCAALYPHVEVAPTPPASALVQPAAAPAPITGSIFSAADYRPLLEDYRARRVGDTLTVQIIENIAASQKSTTAIGKTSSLAGGITAAPLLSANSFARASVGATGANTFSGSGDSENTNAFTGTVTVTVQKVLPNGNLMVTGEKQIGVNMNIDVLRFSGVVDPHTIQSGNMVQSTQVADVRLEHRGRGAQADANAVGWLQRVFLSVLGPM